MDFEVVMIKNFTWSSSKRHTFEVVHGKLKWQGFSSDWTGIFVVSLANANILSIRGEGLVRLR